MSSAGGELEWPALLRDAPVPLTISEPAREALRNSMNHRTADGLAAQRALCAGVQADLGNAQLNRYGVVARDDTIAGIPVRIFEPSRWENKRGTVLLNLHGGGFTKDAGSTTENAPLAGLVGTKVVAVRYRLAPEFPFPAAVDDAEKVYRALLDTTEPADICLYGTSAGAILCTQLLVRLRARGLPMPAALGFFSGSADLSRPGDSEFFFRPAQDESRSGDLFAAYTNGHDPRDPALSPILADLSDFPPTLCMAGTRDFMLSQTALFHRALMAAGVAADLIVFEAMLHAHWIYLDIAESDEAFEHMARFFRRHVRL